MGADTTRNAREAAALPVHARFRQRIDRATETLGIRAALNAAYLLGLAAGRLLRDLRALHDPLAVALARLKQAELTAKVAFDVVDLLSARLDKIPDRHRPYYRADGPDLPGLPEHYLELGEVRRRHRQGRLHGQTDTTHHPPG